MKRLILANLIKWKDEENRKPLLIRGARQVGKTWIVRELGKRFEQYIEINFEMHPEASVIFNDNLEPNELLTKISVTFNKKIVPGKTLIFFDEIQNCPNALKSLRYFYELMPQLHICAAGSLLEFVLSQTGFPVGRIRSINLYPMSYLEFLSAKGEEVLLNLVKEHSPGKPISEIYHRKLLKILGEYIAVGGMPEAVQTWVKSKDFINVQRIHSDIVEAYVQDFPKYAKTHQIKYVEKIFLKIPQMLGKKFTFAKVDREIKARELKPALELLIKSGILNPVYHTSANGIPPGAEMDERKYKIIFLDIGLIQRLMGNNSGNWIIDPLNMLINRGEIAEAFVGQEILAYSDPFIKKSLFYWIREKRSASAEIDYIEAANEKILPIEIKSGKISRSKSMQIFMDEKKSDYGIHFSQRNFFIRDNVRYLPLYSVHKLFL